MGFLFKIHFRCFHKQSRLIQTNPDQSRPIQTYADQPRPIQTNPDQSRPIQINPDQSRLIQTNPEQSRAIQSNPEQSRAIQSNLDQSRPIRTNPDQPTPIQNSKRPRAYYNPSYRKNVALLKTIKNQVTEKSPSCTSCFFTNHQKICKMAVIHDKPKQVDLDLFSATFRFVFHHATYHFQNVNKTKTAEKEISKQENYFFSELCW